MCLGTWLDGVAAKSADLLTFYWFESGSDSCACDVFVRR
jgi:hypothetical protein